MVTLFLVQDRYVGDIGDFGKYALLNALAGHDLRLGVHWYLNADQEDNSDGKFVNYRHLRDCDPNLYDSLQHLVATGTRSVEAVAQSGVLPPSTIYFSSRISSRLVRGREQRRAAWNLDALASLKDADLIFADPDNGLALTDRSLISVSAAKYVGAEEIARFFRRGQSVVVYHHQNREKGGLAVQVASRLALLRSMGLDKVWAVAFKRQSVRVYFVIPAPRHLDILRTRTESFLQTAWGRGGHFQYSCAPDVEPYGNSATE